MLYLSALQGSDEVHQEQLPDLTPPARTPDHVAPIEIWSPIAGDPGHVVHQTGELRYWTLDQGSARTLTIMQERFPDAVWMVVERQVDYRRVPKTDPRYCAIMRETIDPEAPPGDNETVDCRAGHTYVTSADEPGRCWCGEPMALTVA